MALTVRAEYVGPYEASIALVPHGVTLTTGYVANSIFMQPGTFNYAPGNTIYQNVNFVAEAEGVFRCYVFDPVANYYHATTRILCGLSPDPYFLIRCILYCINYGDANHINSPSDALFQMRYGSIYLQCGPAVKVLRLALTQYGFTTRTVHLQAPSNLNGFDDGHILMELWDAALGKWVLIDPNGWLYRHQGAPVSVAEVVEYGLENLDAERLCPFAAIRHDGNSTTVWPSAAFFELRLSSEARMREWAAHIFRMPGINVPGTGAVSYVPTGYSGVENLPRYAAPSQTFMSKTDWLAAFY